MKETTLLGPPTARPQRGRGARIGILCLLSTLFGGCYSTGENPTPVSEKKILKTYEWVYLVRPGGTETDKHLGYIGTGVLELENEAIPVSQVYDTSFIHIGYFLGNGASYRSHEPVDTFLENHQRPRSLQLIYDVSGSFRYKKGL